MKQIFFFFLELPCFLHDTTNFSNLNSGSSVSLKPSLYNRNFSVHILLKPNLKDFEHYLLDFPGSSAGKESTCNAGDPGLIPRLGRSTGEGIGYPLQNSWAFLMVQLVKNPPAMWETWVLVLGWEDPQEKGTATHSSILAWWTRPCSPTKSVSPIMKLP